MNILVTGGTGGVGKAVVGLLATDCNNLVYFTYRGSEEKAQEITSSYKNAIAFKCDQTKPENIRQLCEAIKTWNLDALVNNAWTGTPEGVRFHKLTNEMLVEGFSNNILPLVSITQTALETFREKKSGRIVTVLTASLVGVPPLGYGKYGAEKAYIEQLAKTWSKEYIKFGVTSNCVSPDFMQTSFTSDTDERVIEQMTANHPLKEILAPKQVAEVILSLLNAPKHVNGVNIPINAGTNIL